MTGIETKYIMISLILKGEVQVKKVILLVVLLLLIGCSTAEKIKKLKDDEKTKAYVEDLKVKYEPELKKIYEDKFGNKKN